MATPTVDFGKTEAWAVINSCFLQGKRGWKATEIMKEVLKDDCSSYSTMKIWASQFLSGHFKVIDEPQLWINVHNHKGQSWCCACPDSQDFSKSFSQDSGDFLKKGWQHHPQHSRHDKKAKSLLPCMWSKRRLLTFQINNRRTLHLCIYLAVPLSKALIITTDS